MNEIVFQRIHPITKIYEIKLNGINLTDIINGMYRLSQQNNMDFFSLRECSDHYIECFVLYSD